MSALAGVAAGPNSRSVAVAGATPLLSLAAAEAWRVLRHPALTGGLLLGVVALISSQSQPTSQYFAHTLFALVPVGIGSMLALFLAASRVRRDDAVELVAGTPMPARTRTAALLLAATVVVLPAALLLSAAAVAVGGWRGFALATPSGPVHQLPAPVEVVAPFVGLLACAVTGVLVGRVLPSLTVVPAIALFGMVQIIAVSWSVTWSGRWLLPFVDPTVQVGWVQVTPGSGYGIVAAIPAAPLLLHVIYTVAFVTLVAVTAIALDARSSRWWSAVAGSAVAVGVLGALQLVGAS